MSRAEPVVDDHDGEIHDVVGIGFGPSNLAFAIAVEELGAPGLRALFLERQPKFGWHPRDAVG
jgi:lysine/ornithine N-monooxygenase